MRGWDQTHLLKDFGTAGGAESYLRGMPSYIGDSARANNEASRAQIAKIETEAIDNPWH